LKLDYERKRDRWNGYDPSEHNKLIQKFEILEDIRRKQKLTETSNTDEAVPNNLAASAEEEDEEFIEKEDYNAPVTKVDPKTRTTIRNLRIREDTVKYLSVKTLTSDTAHYDPKSRSMRDTADTSQEAEFVSDKSGEANKFDDVNRFVWNAYERGQEIHMQAAPSQVELLYQQFKVRGDALKKQQKEELLIKYGGVEHLDAPKEFLGTAQSELYLEYSADGKIIRGSEAVIPKSKWEEDVLINNHKTIWGSYWEDGKWGYGCCRQTVKNSYCTGQAGIVAKENPIKEALETEEVQEETKGNETKTKNISIPSMKLTPKDPFATPETPVLDEHKS